jgi:hypothetical protein
MPPKRSRPRVIIMPVAQHGGSLWSDFTDAIKPVGDFLRKTKVVSKAGKFLGSVGVPYAGNIGAVADELGYGKRRRRHPRKKMIKV